MAHEDLPPRTARRRSRLPLIVGLIVLLFVLIAVVPRSGSRSSSLPPGRWGAILACLERNPLDKVTDGSTSAGEVPDGDTTEVTVTRRIRGIGLATVRDAGTPAAARRVARDDPFDEPAANYHTAGPIVWAWSETGSPPQVSADAGDRTLISFCIEHPRR